MTLVYVVCNKWSTLLIVVLVFKIAGVAVLALLTTLAITATFLVYASNYCRTHVHNNSVYSNSYTFPYITLFIILIYPETVPLRA